jgi:hypothetical protein
MPDCTLEIQATQTFLVQRRSTSQAQTNTTNMDRFERVAEHLRQRNVAFDYPGQCWTKAEFETEKELAARLNATHVAQTQGRH